VITAGWASSGKNLFLPNLKFKPVKNGKKLEVPNFTALTLRPIYGLGSMVQAVGLQICKSKIR